MWNDDDRKWLYNQMRKNGVDTGSYDDFSKSLDNKEDRDWYYQKSRSLGLNVGSADDFASMMVQPVQNPAPSPSPAQPVGSQADYRASKPDREHIGAAQASGYADRRDHSECQSASAEYDGVFKATLATPFRTTAGANRP